MAGITHEGEGEGGSIPIDRKETSWCPARALGFSTAFGNLLKLQQRQDRSEVCWEMQEEESQVLACPKVRENSLAPQQTVNPYRKKPSAMRREQLLLSVPSGLVTAASYPLPPQPNPLTSNTASAKPAQLGSPINASRKAILWGLL